VSKTPGWLRRQWQIGVHLRALAPDPALTLVDRDDVEGRAHRLGELVVPVAFQAVGRSPVRAAGIDQEHAPVRRATCGRRPLHHPEVDLRAPSGAFHRSGTDNVAHHAAWFPSHGSNPDSDEDTAACGATTMADSAITMAATTVRRVRPAPVHDLT
jgi:hypothetical protein